MLASGFSRGWATPRGRSPRRSPSSGEMRPGLQRTFRKRRILRSLFIQSAYIISASVFKAPLLCLRITSIISRGSGGSSTPCAGGDEFSFVSFAIHNTGIAAWDRSYPEISEGRRTEGWFNAAVASGVDVWDPGKGGAWEKKTQYTQGVTRVLLLRRHVYST